MIFNCASVSPGVDSLLGNTKLPIHQKKFPLSNYQEPEFTTEDIGNLYQVAQYTGNTKKNMKKFKLLAKTLGIISAKSAQMGNISHMIKHNIKAHELRQTKGISHNTKNKFMEFFKIQDVSLQ